MRSTVLLLSFCVACGGSKGGKRVDDTGATATGTLATGSTPSTGSPTTSTGTVTSAGPYDTDVGGPCVGVSQAGTYVGPTQIRCIDVSCTADQWTWTLLTDGWTRGGTLYLHLQDGSDEEHDIASVGYADSGFWWDELVEELIATDYLHSVSTAAECGSDGSANMTVAAEVWDWNTDELAKCVVFGVDPAYFTAQPRFADCDLWTW